MKASRTSIIVLACSLLFAITARLYPSDIAIFISKVKWAILDGSTVCFDKLCVDIPFDWHLNKDGGDFFNFEGVFPFNSSERGVPISIYVRIEKTNNGCLFPDEENKTVHKIKVDHVDELTVNEIKYCGAEYEPEGMPESRKFNQWILEIIDSDYTINCLYNQIQYDEKSCMDFLNNVYMLPDSDL